MNSPAIPDRCPECGDELFYSSSTQQEFKCLTLVLKDGRTFEGDDCAKRQRDQLAERVKELEARLADRDEAAACAVIQDERREG